MSSKNIAKGLPTFLLVISANFCDPSALNSIATSAVPPVVICWGLPPNVTEAFFKSLPVSPVGLVFSNVGIKKADCVASAAAVAFCSLNYS
jgi:hypothetical protein